MVLLEDFLFYYNILFAGQKLLDPKHWIKRIFSFASNFTAFTESYFLIMTNTFSTFELFFELVVALMLVLTQNKIAISIKRNLVVSYHKYKKNYSFQVKYFTKAICAETKRLKA